jgi:hypothetical protein
MGNRPGINNHWVASNEDLTTFWRAEVVGDKTFKLTGPPVMPEAFGEAGVLRLWEYGVGDSVRQSTFASLRRVEAGVYELAADVDVTVALPGRSLEISQDRAAWQSAEGRPVDDKEQVRLTAQDLGPEGRVYLRVGK